MLTIALLTHTVSTPALAMSLEADMAPECLPVSVRALHPSDGAQVPTTVVPAIFMAGGCGRAWGYELVDAENNILAEQQLTYDYTDVIELPGLELEPGAYTLTVFDEIDQLDRSTFVVVDEAAEAPEIESVELFASTDDEDIYQVEALVEVDGDAVVRMTVEGDEWATALAPTSDEWLYAAAQLGMVSEVCATFEVRGYDGVWTNGLRVCTTPEVHTRAVCGVGCSSVGTMPAFGLFVFGLFGAVSRRR